MNLLKQQKQPPEVFRKKDVLKNFAIFTGKHLCWNLFESLQTSNFIKNRHQHKCFHVNIAKFLITPTNMQTTASETTILRNTSE